MAKQSNFYFCLAVALELIFAQCLAGEMMEGGGCRSFDENTGTPNQPSL